MSHLHPQAAWFLDQIKAQDRAPWHEMSPQAARELFSTFKGSFGEGPEQHSVENISIDCDDQPLDLRIYRPREASHAPVLMYFHGGGWVLGDLDTHDTLCRRIATAAQMVVVATNYRLAPEATYPAAFNDAYQATKYVADNAEQLNVDGNRVSVAGDSAGGNLALAVSLHARDVGGPNICKQVLIYPVIEPNFQSQSYQDFKAGYGLTAETMRWFWDLYTNHESSESAPGDFAYADLGSATLNDLPPTFVLTAEFDVLRDEGERIGEQLKESGVRVLLKRYPGMLHGFLHYGAIFDDAITATDDISHWLNE